MTARLLSRRCFLGTLVASAGAAALARERNGEPDLRVGVLSDIHLSDEAHRKSAAFVKIFEETLAFYKRQNVDAVIIAGDLSNAGQVTELQVTADAWKRVFGEEGPVKIFVTGNHERNYFMGAKRRKEFTSPTYADGLYRDIKANWKALFGEEWSPFFIKKVKGYSFVGAHWGEWRDEKGLTDFLAAHKADLDAARPFFYVQHAHPQDTCHGPVIWHKADGGKVDRILAAYPNAVAFSGHTHYTLVDERCLWQEAFTSVGTASLRAVYLPPGRENGDADRRMTRICGGSQGMLMSVWGDEIVLERYELTRREKVGDDWTIPVLHGASDRRTLLVSERAARAGRPSFPEGTKIRLVGRRGRNPKKEMEDQAMFVFSPAVGQGDSASRTFDYRVTVTAEGRPPLERLVFTPGLAGPAARARGDASCVFGLCELPPPPFRVTVAPRNSFGVEGAPISAEFTELPSVQEKTKG